METLRILWVDDDRFQRNAVSKIFQKAINIPHDLTVLEYGNEAITLLQQGIRFDLVVTDFHLKNQAFNGDVIAIEANERGASKVVVNTSNPYDVHVPEQVEVRQKMVLSDILEILNEVSMKKE